MLKQQIENLKSAAIDSISREAASKTLVKNPIRQSLLQDLINLTIEKAALEAKRIAQEQIIEKLNKDLLQLPSLEQKYANLQRETESLLYKPCGFLKANMKKPRLNVIPRNRISSFLNWLKPPKLPCLMLDFPTLFLVSSLG